MSSARGRRRNPLFSNIKDTATLHSPRRRVFCCWVDLWAKLEVEHHSQSSMGHRHEWRCRWRKWDWLLREKLDAGPIWPLSGWVTQRRTESESPLNIWWTFHLQTMSPLYQRIAWLIPSTWKLSPTLKSIFETMILSHHRPTAWYYDWIFTAQVFVECYPFLFDIYGIHRLTKSNLFKVNHVTQGCNSPTCSPRWSWGSHIISMRA